MAIWYCAKRSRQHTRDKVRLEFSDVGELRNALADIPTDWEVYPDGEGHMIAESQGRPETDDEWKKRVDAEIAKRDSKFPAIVDPENVGYFMHSASQETIYWHKSIKLYKTAQEVVEFEKSKQPQHRLKCFDVRAIEVHPDGSWNPVSGADEMFFVKIGE